MHQFVSAINPSNISPTHRTQCTLYILAHTLCKGSTKRPLAPVLPAIGSEKLTNVPRLHRMDICINAYQQLTPQTSVLRTGPNAHSICRPILYVWEYQTASRPCIASNRESETNQRATATQDGYMHQFVSAVNPSNISPIYALDPIHIVHAGPFFNKYVLHEMASRPCIASNRE